VRHAATHVPGVVAVKDVRARWIGHRLRAEVDISVDPSLDVSQAHTITTDLERELAGHLQFLGGAIIHVEPADSRPDK